MITVYVFINEDNEILNFKSYPAAESIECSVGDEYFLQNPWAYKYIDGNALLNTEKYKRLQDTEVAISEDISTPGIYHASKYPIVPKDTIIYDAGPNKKYLEFYDHLNDYYDIDHKNKKISLNEEKKQNAEQSIKLREIRTFRENECFRYINRGNAWYNTLTESQKNELQQWYEEWLNITDIYLQTGEYIPPTRPEFLGW